MSREIDGLPVAEFAFPGELRDRLVAAILRGEKTSTCTLLVDYERAGDALPEVGTRSVVVDSEEQPVAVIETTELRVLPLGEVDLAFARDEGEGFESVADWRVAHEGFWGSRFADVAVDDDTPIVAERFRLVDVVQQQV
ncbi:MAG: ASCH domain-containing protein [Gaiellaceae bacterium]